MLFGLAALIVSALLAFRRQRLAAPGAPPAGHPDLPGSLREVRLFRLSYEVTVETGQLQEAGRSARRRALRTSTGQLVAWRSPAGTAEPSPAHRLTAVVAGGRVVASRNHATGIIALHEADLAMLHGLGRRGRGLILVPLILATSAFAAMTHRALKDFLPTNAATSAQDLWLSVVVATALFAFGLLMALAIFVGSTSAVFRRVRRAQLRRLYEPALRASLTSPVSATSGDGAAAAGAGDPNRTRVL
jgi:hypothetical protein